MRRLFPSLLAAALLVVSASYPAHAGDTPTTTAPDAETQIVGGSVAGSTQFPFAAAVVRRGSSRLGGLMCGGTVLSRSWVLTAAHCVLDYDDAFPDATYGDYVPPSMFDVVTGTADLTTSDGQRVPVAQIVPYPSYRYDTMDHDVALLRLAQPTSAPGVAVIGSTASELAIDDPGTTATVIGWGTTHEFSRAMSPDLRFADIPVHSDATCASSYPPVPPTGNEAWSYHASTMVCAGPLAGGKDSCQGDSGGPLLARALDASWRQIGVVSWGEGCGQANYPGVYHQLTDSASWVTQTRRFGPFAPDGFAFVARQYQDFTGATPTSGHLRQWLTTLRTAAPAELIEALQASSQWDASAGMNTRLYRAAFGRNPDSSGLGFWIRQRRSGTGPVTIAEGFARSSEFIGRYGALDDAGFVQQIYRNVFGRETDAAGLAYWVGRLGSNTSRGELLYALSNSSEYRTDTATLVRIITTRFALLGQVPSAAEITASQSLTQRALVDSLRTSYRYATRIAS